MIRTSGDKCYCGKTVKVRVHIDADLSSTHKEKWRLVPVDACVAPIVRALSEGGIYMRSSCCGHGNGPGEIVLSKNSLWPHGGRLIITGEG